MARIADRYKQQINIDTPFLGVYPDLASAREALRQAVHFSNSGWINLCTPSPEIYSLPPFRALALSRVDPLHVELYPFTRDQDDKRDAGKNYGIPKGFLDSLKQLRQVQILDTRRVDDGTIDALWTYQCTVMSPDLLGGAVTITKSRTVDLRDGSPDLLKSAGRNQTVGAINAARLNGPQVAESKAQNRAVAEALNVARGMTEAEFYRPWITVALVPHVPVQLLSQEAIDAAGLAIIGGTAALYGARRQHQNLPPAAPPAALTPSIPATSEDYVEPDASEDEPSPASPAAPRESAPPAPPARTAGGAALASKAQLEALTVAWNRLGRDEFTRRAEEALGCAMPASSTLTATQAQVMLDAFAAGGSVPPF